MEHQRDYAKPGEREIQHFRDFPTENRSSLLFSHSADTTRQRQCTASRWHQANRWQSYRSSLIFCSRLCSKCASKLIISLHSELTMSCCSEKSQRNSEIELETRSRFYRSWLQLLPNICNNDATIFFSSLLFSVFFSCEHLQIVRMRCGARRLCSDLCSLSLSRHSTRSRNADWTGLCARRERMCL